MQRFFLGVVLAVASAFAAPAVRGDSLVFTVLPPDISGSPGETIGWGYSITNNSTGTIAIESLAIIGSYEWGDYAQTNNCPASLPPTGSCIAEVTFTPTALGTTSTPTTLLVSFQSGDSPFSVSLSGSGLASTNNAAPRISQPLIPTSVPPGGKAITMRVYGARFAPSSVVNFNGTPLSTVFKTTRQLSATVPASLISKAGTASVTVVAPGPGGGTSNVAFFPVVAPSVSVSFLPQSMGVGTTPNGIVTADFNGDNIQDLAVANQGSNTISILLGNGDGTFTEGTTLTTGNQPGALVAGDFNGDGQIDLAVADAADSRVLVFLGNGDGTFTPASPVDCNLVDQCGNTVDPVALAVGDFNGDGNLDLAVVNESISTISILFGAGDGTFRIQSTTPVALKGPTAVTAGDFNGDGITDLAVNSPTANTVEILLGQSSGVFKSVGSISTPGPGMLVAADFNNDQKTDLAVLNPAASTVTVFFGNGNGTFQTGVPYATGAGPASILVGDFNADGVLDLATANSTGNSISVLLGVAGGTFLPHTDTPAGGSPVWITAGGFNSNGLLDLAVTNSTGNSISIFLNTPSHSIAFPPGFPPAGDGR